ncbi:amidohydrolase family protein [Lentzea californiensis]|uniref:amidohydrolase family protein n=1 Tax=Lentzea californiensis TaxID=438851 RepID=UPI002164FDFB|nr:amidohydrolase family protein [Lentzea californiensis]MCR3750840.1 Imidazolonepropionase [Lentzea californiensis]
MTTAIENVRVFDRSAMSEPRRVVFGKSVLADDTAAADMVVDAAGGVLLPGLIDAHVHTVRGRADLEDLARWGVTTGLDMGAWPLAFVGDVRRQKGVAQILSATIPAVGPGGHHARMPGFPAEGIVNNPDEARAFVARRVADGADYIKIVTEAAPPEGMDQATVNALVRAAHEHGLLVVAHSVTTGAFRVAVESGVDVSTHAPLDAVLDDDTIAGMREIGMVSVPTLTMMEGTANLFAGAGFRYEHARDTVTAFHDAGIRVLAGTDANSAPGAPFAPKHGESLHHELELMVAAGLTRIEALASATSLPAQVFGLGDRGVIAAGKRADLLLVDGDPASGGTRDIAGVWIAGDRVR